jgi:biopolymer transport protein ExbB
MKNWFTLFVITASMVVSFAIWEYWMGNAGNFDDGAKRHMPKKGNVLGMIYTGGPLVAVLLGLLVIGVTYVFERAIVVSKAKGKSNPQQFLKKVQANLTSGAVDAAIQDCQKQGGSMANILLAGIERYKQVLNDPEFDTEKKISEIQRAIDETSNLETPLLEKNLVILSTVASTSTMVGLLGTTVGMIRAFAALAEGSGAVSAQQLSLGISEALYNTAGGLLAAIIAIVAFNAFSTVVDNFVYTIDEGILEVMEIFTDKIKSNKA